MTKVTILGAGSLAFARDLITDLLSFPALRDVTISLMDIDEDRLEKTASLATAIVDEHDLPATVEATTDRREALQGADYVITTIHVGGAEPFENEIQIPATYGVRQAVGDTLGPGGVFRALRTIPTMVDIARDMEDLCPDAILLQHTNPMAMVCWAVEEATTIDTYGVCHSVQSTTQTIAEYVDVPYAEIDHWIAGINHMAWYLRLEHEGRDLRPDLRAAMAEDANYADDVIRFEVMDHFGTFITESSHHLSEYLPYFRRDEATLEDYLDRSSHRSDVGEFEHSPVCWLPTGEYYRQWNALDPAAEFDVADADLDLERSDEYAARIIHSVETGTVRTANLNVPNDGRLITNLPDDALVEVPCLIDGTGVHPCSVGELPPQLAALNRTNINVQSLGVRAALDRDEKALRRAIKLDPLTAASCTLDEIDAMVDDLLTANDSYLPDLD